MQQPSPTPQSIAQAPTPQVDRERRERMLDAWKAYRGEFQNPLKVERDQPDDNVISNHMEPIVTKGASFLFGPVLKIEASEEATEGSSASTKPTPIQDFIDGIWGDDDDRMTTLSKLAINGGVCGECFVKIVPAQGQMRFPRLVLLDPTIVRIVTPPDDCDLILAYIIEYPGANGFYKRQVITRIDPDNMAGIAGEYDLDDTWTICNYERKDTQSIWAQIGSSTDWPYPFAPIFTSQNLPNPNESWGTPDLTQDLINENKVLNFLLSNLARITKYHGHPITVATGVRTSEIQLTVDGMVCLPSPNSKIEKIAPMDNFSGLLSFVANIMSNIDEQSRVPAVALGRSTELPRGNLSGVALALLFQPLLEKTVQKQRLYGRLIREVTRAALVIAGKIDIADYEDYGIELHWQNLLPVDDLAAAQTAQILLTLGVSQATVLQELGYNPDDEGEKTEVETAKKKAAMPTPVPVPPQQPPVAPGQPVAQDAQQQPVAVGAK